MEFPVFRALGDSFGYLVGHFFTLLKILWLPTALLSIIDLFFTAGASQAFGGNGWYVFLALFFLYVAVFAMTIAGPLRFIIRGETPGRAFYFQFGRDEWRVIGATILFFIILIGLYAVGAITLFVVGLLIAMIGGETVGGILLALLIAAALVAAVWFSVRLSLIYAAAIGDRSLGIGGSWSLTGGKFWLLLLFWILWWLIISAAFIPVALIVLAALSQAPGAMIADPEALMVNGWNMTSPSAWIYVGFSFLANLIGTAVSLAPAGVAYKHLAGK